MADGELRRVRSGSPITATLPISASQRRDLLADDTVIVTYCECPRAAAEYVNGKIREQGFTNTAVLWEGIRGWVSLGYPVSRGEATVVDVKDEHGF